MSKLTWNAVGSRFYEAGVDRGVLYIDDNAVPWNGLTGVSEESSGGEAKPYYLDGIKYLNLPSREDFEGTITAFTYPTEFGPCDGTARVRPGLFLTQQRRKPFGFSYRTRVGNDLRGNELGYKIHLIYNALAQPSNRGYSTQGKETEALEFSWKITTKPLRIAGYQSTAHLILDSRYIHPVTMSKLEDMLYGTDDSAAGLPSFDELIAQLDEPVSFDLIDNGDGTFEIDAPNDILSTDPVAGTFTLDWPTADYNGDGITYTIGSS